MEYMSNLLKTLAWVGAVLLIATIIGIGEIKAPSQLTLDAQNKPQSAVKPQDNLPVPVTIETNNLELGWEAPSVVVGADGAPMISYQDSNSLKLVKCADNSCVSHTLQAIDPVEANKTRYMPSQTSISVGKDGFPIIAYDADFYIKIAKCNDSLCSSPTVHVLDPMGGGIDSASSIVVTSDGLPLVSYHYMDKEGQLKLRVAKCVDISCSATSIHDLDTKGTFAGKSSVIAIGADGLPVISYYNSDHLKFIRCDDISCASSTIRDRDFSLSVARHISMAIGKDGFPIIAYSDGMPFLENKDVKLLNHHSINVLKCGDPSCVLTKTSIPIVTKNSEQNGALGGSIAISIGTNGLPFIVDNENGALRLARCDDTSCTSATTLTLDSIGDTYLYSASIAMGRDDLPFIAYFDSANNAIRYIHCNTYCTK